MIKVAMFESKGIFEADIEGLKFVTAFNKDLHQYEPFSTAKGYNGPVVLICGTADELVDENTCNKYLEIYGDKAEFVSVEGGNHNFASLPARTACNAAVVAFAKKFL